MHPHSPPFSVTHPIAHRAFCRSGWSGINYFQKGDGTNVLKGTNAEGQIIEIAVPGLRRTRTVISDAQMLILLAENNIEIESWVGSDYLSYLKGWGFNPSNERQHELFEKTSSSHPDLTVYLDISAWDQEQALLFVEKNGRRIETVMLKDVDNIYKLGAYLANSGWFE